MNIDLADKVAIVTGGARDIGKQIAIQLAQAGARVSVNYSQSEAEAKAMVAEIERAGGKAIAIQANLSQQPGAEKLVQKTLDAFGDKIHILVNNAGGLVARKKMEEMDEAFWDEVMAINLKTMFLASKAALPHMADGGAIVNFSSQAGRDGGGMGAIAYSTAKGGVLTFTRGLAKELGPRRIRVNAVAPGMINTTFHNTFTKPEVRQKVAGMTPLGREGEAAEVAALVVFLASGLSPFVNGAAIDVNGGTYFS
jgi:3-oxoacyl-[acyl-carrier protein] reductase